VGNELAFRRPDEPIVLSIDSLLVRFLRKCRTETTRSAYARDITDFTRFVQQRTADDAVAILTSGTRFAANRLIEDYVSHLGRRKLASATIARRLATLSSLITRARKWGYIDWEIDVDRPDVEQYKDVTGPGREGMAAIKETASHLAEIPARGDDPEAARRHKRNWALIALMSHLALRRGECVSLDLADVELGRSRVWVLGKGRQTKKPLTLPIETRAILADWIAARGKEPGPLFIRLDPGARGVQRLTGEAVYRAVIDISNRAGLETPAKPHGIRHASITRADELTNGNMTETQDFARHLDRNMTKKYIDANKDNFGKVARLLAADK
jgi:integrase/recombinase XerC